MEPEEKIVETEKQPIDPFGLPEFKQVVVLSDGTELPGRAALNEADDDLWIWLDDTTLIAVFPIFSDKEKTKKITTKSSALYTKTWENYTALSVIQQRGEKVVICMRKEK